MVNSKSSNLDSSNEKAARLAATVKDQHPPKRRKLVKVREKPRSPEASDTRPTAAQEPCESAVDRLSSEELPSVANAANSNAAGSGSESEDEEIRPDQRANDSVCLNCDDGGEILMCDGPCMRSFHANPDCNIFKIPPELLKVLQDSSDQFLCPLCLAGRHRCNVCQQLASSQDGPQGPKELFRCSVSTCGHFYHPRCIGQTRKQLETEPFACPLHTCKVCRNDTDAPGNEIIPCRRCSRAYHLQCCPPELLDADPQRIWISAADTDTESGIAQSLLYCPRHAIPAGRDIPEFEEPPIPSDLLHQWQLQYACQHPDLAWSEETLKAQVAGSKARKARIQASHQAGIAGPQSPRSRQAAAGIMPSPLTMKQSDLPSKPQQREQNTSGSKAMAANTVTAPLQAITEKCQVNSSIAVQPSGADAREYQQTTASALAASKVSTEKPLKPLQMPITATSDLQKAAAATNPQQIAVLADGTSSPTVSAQTTLEQDNAAVEAVSEPQEELLEFETDQFWSAAAQDQSINRLLNSAGDCITEQMVHRAARKPNPYNYVSKRTIDTERLQGHQASLQLAVKNPGQVRQVLPPAALKDVDYFEDNLRTVMAPILQAQRYTSYGRHFTKAPQMEAVAIRLLDHLLPGDTVVDFSCGSNEFVPMVKEKALRAGIEVFGKCYDIITGRHFEDLVIKSWFDVSTGELPRGDQLVIGLNPPFGKDGTLANKFIDKAAHFQPRIIVLIVPPQCIIPHNYSVQYEDLQIMADKAFYIPGGDKHCQSWNKTTPAVRILLRNDFGPSSFRDPTIWSTHLHQPVFPEFARSMAPPMGYQPMAMAQPGFAFQDPMQYQPAPFQMHHPGGQWGQAPMGGHF